MLSSQKGFQNAFSYSSGLFSYRLGEKTERYAAFFSNNLRECFWDLKYI